MKNNSKWASLLTAVALMAGLTMWANAQAQSGAGDAASTGKTVAASPFPGKAAPDFALRDLDGQEVSLESLRGKKVFLNFWASWCGPCNAEMPHLVELSREYGGEVVFVGVNLTARDDEEKARQFVAKYGLPFPNLLDEEDAAGDGYRVVTIPTTVTIDANGIVVDRAQGQVSKSGMEEMIRKLAGRS